MLHNVDERNLNGRYFEPSPSAECMACDTTIAIAVTQTSQGVSRAEERMGRLSRTRNMIMFKYILIASSHASYSSISSRRFGDPSRRVSSSPSLVSHCVMLHCQHIVIALLLHHHLIVVVSPPSPLPLPRRHCRIVTVTVSHVALFTLHVNTS
jgi:hypothetical protein